MIIESSVAVSISCLIMEYIEMHNYLKIFSFRNYSILMIAFQEYACVLKCVWVIINAIYSIFYNCNLQVNDDITNIMKLGNKYELKVIELNNCNIE